MTKLAWVERYSVIQFSRGNDRVGWLTGIYPPPTLCCERNPDTANDEDNVTPIHD